MLSGTSENLKQLSSFANKKYEFDLDKNSASLTKRKGVLFLSREDNQFDV
jgi:hypothetical protein